MDKGYCLCINTPWLIYEKQILDLEYRYFISLLNQGFHTGSVSSLQERQNPKPHTGIGSQWMPKWLDPERMCTVDIGTAMSRTPLPQWWQSLPRVMSINIVCRKCPPQFLPFFHTHNLKTVPWQRLLLLKLAKPVVLTRLYIISPPCL